MKPKFVTEFTDVSEYPTSLTFIYPQHKVVIFLETEIFETNMHVA